MGLSGLPRRRRALHGQWLPGVPSRAAFSFFVAHAILSLLPGYGSLRSDFARQRVRHLCGAVGQECSDAL